VRDNITRYPHEKKKKKVEALDSFHFSKMRTERVPATLNNIQKEKRRKKTAKKKKGLQWTGGPWKGSRGAQDRKQKARNFAFKADTILPTFGKNDDTPIVEINDIHRAFRPTKSFVGLISWQEEQGMGQVWRSGHAMDYGHDH
jgi:hypothetical protein